MCRTLVYWVSLVLVTLVPGALLADIQTGLVGYWPLNEGAGTTTADLTGVNLAPVKKLYLGVGDRKTPVPGGSGRIYIDDIRVTKP